MTKQTQHEKKETRITLANVIAIVAIAALGVLTFLGYSFKSAGEHIGKNILISAAITLGNAILLVALIKIKTAENDLRKFRVVEYIIFAVFIAYSAYFAQYPYHFLRVSSNKESIKKIAIQDFNNISALFTVYEKNMKSDINTLETELKDAYYGKSEQSKELKKFFKEKTPQKYISELQNKHYRGDHYQIAKDRYNTQLEAYKNQLIEWNLLNIASLPNNTIATTVAIQNYLTNLQGEGIEVVKKVKGQYQYQKRVKHNYNQIVIYEDNKLKECNIKFINKIKYNSNTYFAGICITILIYLLILFNYFVVYRTDITYNKKQDDDGGIIIK